MGSLFAIQVATSFLVGGIAAAAQSIIAERVPPRIAGFILTLPLTLSIGLLFLGWTLSPQGVADIVPVLPLTTGASLIFAVVYMYLAKRLHASRTAAVIICACGAVCTWLAISVPLAAASFSNLALSLAGFGVIFLAGHALLARLRHQTPAQGAISYTTGQKIGRALFAGAIIAAAVYLSKTLGPFWGGILSAFPAATLASLIILHWYRGPSLLIAISKTMPVGFCGLVVYAVASRYTFPAFGAIGGTIASYAVTLAFLLPLMLRRSSANR